jgi:hypothetical protein
MFRLLVLLSSCVISALAFAHGSNIGDLHIFHPAARPTVPGQMSAAVYLKIENKGKQADRLIAVGTPIAASSQIHSMSMDGNMLKMREVEGVDLAPGAKVAMRSGPGYHIMLTGLKNPLKAGDKFPLTLTFQKAGKAEASVVVEGNAGGSEKAVDTHAH